ncbi:hypothetical protein [Paenisporosarcina sp.]|uniref:hypothetical protein n=1 Tax=Paenisporosarcina sp. TaxID=1932001 RepID=UPI003C7853C2
MKNEASRLKNHIRKSSDSFFNRKGYRAKRTAPFKDLKNHSNSPTSHCLVGVSVKEVMAIVLSGRSVVKMGVDVGTIGFHVGNLEVHVGIIAVHVGIPDSLIKNPCDERR